MDPAIPCNASNIYLYEMYRMKWNRIKFLYRALQYYNKEVKRLKIKVRREYNKRKLGQRYQMELKRLSKELVVAKKRTAQETFLRSVLRNEGNCWYEFYKNVKRWKGNREIIPATKDRNGTIIRDTTGKADILNSYYASVFCCGPNILEIKLANTGETLISNTKVITIN